MNTVVPFEDIKQCLDSYFFLLKNDSDNWKKLEEHIPGAICNSQTNTPETIDRGIVRFIFQGFIYEYNGELKCFLSD